jgi:hypothetical protein
VLIHVHGYPALVFLAVYRSHLKTLEELVGHVSLDFGLVVDDLIGRVSSGIHRLFESMRRFWIDSQDIIGDVYMRLDCAVDWFEYLVTASADCSVYSLLRLGPGPLWFEYMHMSHTLKIQAFHRRGR